MVELDHLLWAACNLDDGIAANAASTGVAPAVGGSHRDFGTRNGLQSLGSAAAEVISPDPEQDLADKELIAGSREAGTWAKTNLDKVTTSLAAATGIDEKILATVDRNASFDVVLLSRNILDGRQNAADRLFRFGLPPGRVAIRDGIWKGAGT